MLQNTKSEYTPVKGRLEDSVLEVIPETIQHAHEILREGLKDKEIFGYIGNDYLTADFGMIALEEGEPVIYLVGREHNLILQNLETSLKHIEQTRDKNGTGGYVKLDNADYETIITAVSEGKGIRVALKELELEEREPYYWPGHGEFDFETACYDLNESQKSLAEWVSSRGKEFAPTMDLFSKSGINKVNIMMTLPDYAARSAVTEPIGVAVYLSSSEECAYFDLTKSWYARDENYVLAKLNPAEEAKAARANKVSAAIETLRSNPESLGERMVQNLRELIEKYEEGWAGRIDSEK